MPPHDLTLHRESPPAVRTMIDRRVGRYRVLAALGRGGMSSVWRAHDELLGRDIALKLLADDLASSSRARRRFRHEARVAASLDHPAVAAVYDSGEADGVTFIAMALIDGETVAERLERSLLPVAEAVRVAVAVAGALDYAHSHGVVHRDVTSRNIMLARDGRVLVLDFGLALAAGVSRVSSTHTMMGTASYMAPEVLTGRDADSRSDLYGLGVVLHEMLTGRVPFDGERRETITYAALNQEPTPPSRWRAEVGAELDRVVLRLLAREPAERYPSAQALLADLGATHMGRSVSKPVTSGTASPATSSADTRSVGAEIVASGHRPLYLVLVPFATETEPGTEPMVGRLAMDLTKTLSASITHLGKVHLVTAEAPAPGEEAGAYTRRVGAHVQLGGSVHVDGATARVTWRLIDADRGAQIAAGSVRGAAADVVNLEDLLVADVRRGLGLKVERGGFDSRAVTEVPAAADRYQQALRYLVRFDHEASIDGAIGILERLTTAMPENGVLYAVLVRGYLAKFGLTMQHAWEARAAAAADHALRLAPTAVETRLAVGEIHLAAGQTERALSEFQSALASDRNCFEALLGVARAHEASGRHDEAEANCREAIALRPNDWRGHHDLGLVLFKKGEFGRAVEPWRRVLQLTPDNARAASNLGSALFRMDRFTDAIDAYRHSLEMHPTAWGFTNLGTALYYEGRYQEAADACEHAASLTPSDPVMWGNLGNAQRLTPGREAAAHEALERATGLMQERLHHDPTDAMGWARLGGWLLGLGRREESLAAVRRATELAPRDGTVWSSAGHTLFLAGDRDAALVALAAAIEHGYGIDALRRSRELAPLREDPRFQRILTSDSPDDGVDMGSTEQGGV